MRLEGDAAALNGVTGKIVDDPDREEDPDAFGIRLDKPIGRLKATRVDRVNLAVVEGR